MKKICFALLVLIPSVVICQVRTALFYSAESVDLGLNVNTQIPFSQDHNVRLHIEGSDLINGAFNIDMFCGIENGDFTWLQASSSAGSLPIDIVAFKKNGKLGLNLVGGYYKLQLVVTGYAEAGADSTIFQNWTVSLDEGWDAGGTDPIILSYSNSFGHVGGWGSSFLEKLTSWNLNVSKAIRNGSPSGSYYEAEGNSYISQNATFDNATSTWKSISSKSTSGNAVLLQSLGKDGKAFDISVDTSIATNNEELEFANLLTVAVDGKTGIGSRTPKEKLQVKGNVSIEGVGLGLRFNNYFDPVGGKSKYFSSGYASSFILDSLGSLVYSNTNTLASGVGNSITMNDVFSITKDGFVGIGTKTPQAKLAVNGDIYSKKVKVTATGWPDYVFEPGYKLPDLVEVERFIQANKHLPGIVSAKEVERDGNDLGDTQAAMLKKIEELTLYIIDLNKRVTELEKQNADLKSTIKTSAQ